MKRFIDVAIRKTIYSHKVPPYATKLFFLLLKKDVYDDQCSNRLKMLFFFFYVQSF
jgi:hypothetical protein